MNFVLSGVAGACIACLVCLYRPELGFWPRVVETTVWIVLWSLTVGIIRLP